jgi:hypothetical protein
MKSTRKLLDSGELFTGDLRAFMPRTVVIPNIEDAAPSDRACEWKPGGADCVATKSYWFRVNHLLISLCRLHAKMMARKRGIEVVCSGSKKQFAESCSLAAG